MSEHLEGVGQQGLSGWRPPARTNRAWSRRRLLLDVLGGSGLALLKRGVAGQGTPSALSFACPGLPGFQLLLDWWAGKPVLDPAELVPPPDWKVFSEPDYSTTFRYPPDWTGSALFSSGLTPDGALVWRTTTSSTDYLFSARIV